VDNVVMISHTGKWGLNLCWGTLILSATTTAQNIATHLSDSQQGFGLDIGFIDQLYTYDS
jgi:hypothetical protein